MTQPLCELLEWDSEFFGFRIARVVPPRLAGEDVQSVYDWCSSERIRCLYLLADGMDSVTAQTAGIGGFRFVDCRVVLETGGLTERPPEMPPSIRLATPEDVRALEEIARTSHTDSRFYFDPEFPRERCDALYSTWIRKSCSEGLADAVLVVIDSSRTAGYISCSVKGEVGQIGLIAVGDWARGAGHGKTLVQSALRWFYEHGVTKIRVVTQGRNVPAQRLYQRCGFLTRASDCWYHRWFSTS